MQESGVHEYEFQNLYQRFTRGKGFMALTKRTVTKIERPEVPLPVIRLHNTKVFLCVMAGMVLLPLLALAVELLYHKRPQLFSRLKKMIVSLLRFVRRQLYRFKWRPSVTKVRPVSGVQVLGSSHRVEADGSSLFTKRKCVTASGGRIRPRTARV